MFKKIILSLFIFLGVISSLRGNERFYPEINVREWALENGMKVFFKPTQTDPEQITVRILAKGGYLNLSAEEKLAYENELEVVAEAGFGPFNRDQLSMFFYQQGIECTLKIDPYARIVDASVYSDSLPIFFAFVNQVFAGNKKLDQFFTNPNEFIVILVGDTTVQKIQSEVIASLSKIEKRNGSISYHYKNDTPNLQEVSQKKLKEEYVFSTQTQELSFFLPYPLDEDKHHLLTMLCLILKERLIQNVSSSDNFRVSYDVPSFPYSIFPQLRIRYRVSPLRNQSSKQSVYNEIRLLKKFGPTLDELKIAHGIISKNQPLLLNDNLAWTAMISNFALLNWKLEKIVPSEESSGKDMQSLIPELSMH